MKNCQYKKTEYRKIANKKVKKRKWEMKNSLENMKKTENKDCKSKIKNKKKNN